MDGAPGWPASHALSRFSSQMEESGLTPTSSPFGNASRSCGVSILSPRTLIVALPLYVLTRSSKRRALLGSYAMAMSLGGVAPAGSDGPMQAATDIANIKDTKANDTSRNIAQSYFSYTLTNQLPRLTNPERDACRILDDAGTLSLKPKLA